MAEKLTVEEILEIARQAMATYESGSGGQFGPFNPTNPFSPEAQIQQNVGYMSSTPGLLNPILESAMTQTPEKQRPDLMAGIINVATPRITTHSPGMVVRRAVAKNVLTGMLPKDSKINFNTVKQLADIISKQVEDRRASNFGGAQGLWT
jgi:hypothetical protein